MTVFGTELGTGAGVVVAGAVVRAGTGADSVVIVIASACCEFEPEMPPVTTRCTPKNSTSSACTKSDAAHAAVQRRREEFNMRRTDWRMIVFFRAGGWKHSIQARAFHHA
jgi:hypothetical protein